ncbi:MAG: hypothetical protein PSY14_06225 [bacterium]|nr:hypothetical protein [bacterium]
MSEINKVPVVRNDQKIKIDSLAFTKDKLRKFCDILQERALAAAELEVEIYIQTVGKDKAVDDDILKLRQGFQLKVNLVGNGGVTLWGSIPEVFSSVNFPIHVESLFIDSKTPLKVTHNYHPHNELTVFLQFSKPKIFDFTVLPGNETPNESNVAVCGSNPTWVNGVFHELVSFINAHPAPVRFVHKQSVYDLVMFTFNIPVAFYVCYRLQGSLNGITDTFIRNTLYVYIFCFVLIFFRCLFHYARWVFPRVDYVTPDNRTKAHQATIISIIVGMFGKLLYDLLNAI